MTNYERLRRMKKKELTEWLYKLSEASWACSECPHCIYGEVKKCPDDAIKGGEVSARFCKESILRWLKSEVKGK